MAFFKFRKGGDESAAAPVKPESVEALRRRARHRLIGAAVLVGVGVLGFPLLFDTQPRSIGVDIPIEIPDRNKAGPLPLPVSTAPKAETAASHPVEAAVVGKSAAPAPARPVASGAVTSATAEAKPESKPEPKVEAKVEPKSEPKAEVKAEARPEAREAPKPVASASKSQPVAPAQAAAKPAVDPDSAARARALLDGQPVQVAASPAAVEGRYVVQVGAFADPAKARETRLRVERAGLKTYTHVAETKAGKRIRVRVGPFETRAQADKAAGKIKELDLPAAILTL